MAAWRYEISLLVLKKREISKRNFVSPRGHVISSIYFFRNISIPDCIIRLASFRCLDNVKVGVFRGLIFLRHRYKTASENAWELSVTFNR